MSDHAHAGAADGHGHGDHHYVYEGTPANEPGPDEPVTPGWFTLLGIGLVLVIMLGFVATRPDGKTRAELAPSAAASAPAAPAPQPQQAPRPVPTEGRPGSVTPEILRRQLEGTTRPGQAPGQFAVQPGGAGSAAPRRPARPPAQ
jgi:hypothetical protein